MLTSSVEPTGRWVPREALATGAFFRRLEAREEVLFLAAASGDLATTAASWEGGSSAAGASTRGAVAASFLGFSLSLKKEQKVDTLHESKERDRITVKYSSQQNTHESRRSKISTSSPRTEASPVTFLGAEVLEEKSSSTHFLFLSRLGSSECAGGGDVVELVPSSESSASSLSWLSSASGASDAAETGTA
jgi:hypothetical protein